MPETSLQTSRKYFDYNAIEDRQLRAKLRKKAVEGRAILKRTAQSAWEMGELLADIKGEVGHGNFGRWIDAEFGLSDRMAQRFINVHTHFKSDILSDLNASPSVWIMLAAPSVDEETREVAVELIKSGDVKSTADARAVIEAGKPPANTQNGHAEHLEDAEADEDLEDNGISLDDVREGQQEALAQRAANATVVHDTMTTSTPAAPVVNEDDLTDDEWLGTLPIIKYFAGTGLSMIPLRRACLAYRSLHQARALNAWKHHAARAIDFRGLMNMSEPETVIYYAAHLKHPRDWKVCVCKGRGCTHCNATGFRQNDGIDPDRLMGASTQGGAR